MQNYHFYSVIDGTEKTQKNVNREILKPGIVPGNQGSDCKYALRHN